jgi:hypothetical protein
MVLVRNWNCEVDGCFVADREQMKGDGKVRAVWVLLLGGFTVRNGIGVIVR